MHVILLDLNRNITKVFLSCPLSPSLQTPCPPEMLLLSHFSHVRLLVTPQSVAYQAPPSVGFSRQEYWTGVPLPSPARDAKRAQTNLVHTRTQGPHRDWDRPVFEHLLWRYRSTVNCHRYRSSGCRRLGYGISHITTILIAKFRLKLRK